MTDDIMTRVREWLASCVRVATENGVPEEADLEAATLLAHIDGEPARLAAAREEQNALLLRALEHGKGLANYEYLRAHALKALYLPATPLADEIAFLKKYRDEREAYWLEREAKWIAERDIYADGSKFHADRAEKAEAERDALKSRLYGPLTAEESLTETEARQAMASGVSADKLGTFLGRVYKTVGERDALRAERDARYDCKGGPGTTAPECGGCATCLHRVIVGVEAERDALRAQLLSERERLERWLTAPDGKQYERGTVQAVFDECDALRAQQVDLLDAMDKSKP